MSSKGRPARRSDTRSDVGALVILAMLFGVVALLGGSSRQDATQLLLLRPAVALFLIPCALVLAQIGQARPLRPLLVMLLALTAWTALQLVPLPPSLWTALPGRDPIAALDGLLGMSDTWRPLSLAPARGLGALAGLVVPVIGLLLVMGYARRRSHLIVALIVLGLGNAAFGLAQVVADGFYPYQISNRGFPVGFFANRNHSAILSAITLVLLFYQLSEDRARKLGAVSRLGLAFGGLVPLLAILLSGSRTGLLLGGAALVLGAVMMWLSRPRAPEELSRRADRPGRMPGPAVLGAVAIGAAAALGALIYWQAPGALVAIGGTGDFEDMRWQIWPVLLDMVRSYGVLGTGFGSFDRVFMIHEPDTLLLPTYVNQAHNDFLQLIIEGGLPAVALAGWCMVWIGRALIAVRANAPDAARVLAWAAMIAFILIGSLFDYPLRTPLFQLVAVVLLAILATERERGFEPAQHSPRRSQRRRER